MRGASASVRNAATGTIGNVTRSGTAVRTLSDMLRTRGAYMNVFTFYPGGVLVLCKSFLDPGPWLCVSFFWLRLPLSFIAWRHFGRNFPHVT